MKVVTLTLNPAIDKSSTVDRIAPDSKLRCTKPTFEPGGGGINVSRALHAFDQDSLALYLGGGATGEMMKEMLTAAGVTLEEIPIADRIRENFIIYNTTTDEQFRFGMPGASVTSEEWGICLDKLRNLNPFPEYLVCSGSLPSDLPDDAYGQIAKVVKEKGGKMILDTSGPALYKALEVGVYLVKPNLKELSILGDRAEIHGNDQESIARELINKGKAEIIAVSLGSRGVMLATANEVHYVSPPTIVKKSTVGAGDSMVAGMTYSLLQGKSIEEMARFGVACGTAATMNPGTQLCKPKDVAWVLEHVQSSMKMMN